MTRLPDWPDRLVAIEERMRDWPFRLGRHDCATATLTVLEAITGQRLVTLRPRRQCATVGAIARATARSLGLRMQSPAMAQRGDPVLAGDGEDERLGWIGSDGRPTFLAPDGYVRYPRESVTAAWMVP